MILNGFFDLVIYFFKLNYYIIKCFFIKFLTYTILYLSIKVKIDYYFYKFFIKVGENPKVFF